MTVHRGDPDVLCERSQRLTEPSVSIWFRKLCDTATLDLTPPSVLAAGQHKGDSQNAIPKTNIPIGPLRGGCLRGLDLIVPDTIQCNDTETKEQGRARECA